MSSPDLDVIKEIPGYKVILKAILKSQIQQLVEQLATHTDEESVILTASVSDGTLSHLGSDSGKFFLEDHEDVKSQFLGFCLKRHHRRKQEKEREKIEMENAEAIRSMAATAASRRIGGRPDFMPGRSPRQHFSQRFVAPRQQFTPNMRHEPYFVNRPPNRTQTKHTEIPVPQNIMKSPGARMANNETKTQIIKIEAEDPAMLNTYHTVSDPNNQTMSGTSGVPSSSPPSSPSLQTPPAESSTPQMKTEEDDARSDTSSSTIPNEVSDLKFSDSAPPEGLSLDSDLSNLISTENNSGGDSSNIEQPATPQTSGSAPPTPGSSSGLDPNINVKVEAITESEMELEITGVEPGKMPDVGLVTQDNWVPDGQGGMYDPSGAMGNPEDMQAYNKYLLNQTREGTHTCTYCGKIFPNAYPLKRHLKIHTGEKAFKCEICGKCFTLKHHLKGHMAVHMKDTFPE